MGHVHHPGIWGRGITPLQHPSYQRPCGLDPSSLTHPVISKERIAASPCGGLSPPPSPLLDKTPQRLAVGFPSDSTPPPPCQAGAVGASQVLRRLSSCMPRPEDSGGPAPPRLIGCARVAFGSVKTLGVRNSHVEAVPALQGARSPLRPTGCSVYASPISCSPSTSRLRNGRKTRYGWVASPYPTGTFTR
jgi:hypothetical protein